MKMTLLGLVAVCALGLSTLTVLGDKAEKPSTQPTEQAASCCVAPKAEAKKETKEEKASQSCCCTTAEEKEPKPTCGTASE